MLSSIYSVLQPFIVRVCSSYIQPQYSYKFLYYNFTCISIFPYLRLSSFHNPSFLHFLLCSFPPQCYLFFPFLYPLSINSFITLIFPFHHQSAFTVLLALPLSMSDPHTTYINILPPTTPATPHVPINMDSDPLLDSDPLFDDPCWPELTPSWNELVPASWNPSEPTASSLPQPYANPCWPHLTPHYLTHFNPYLSQFDPYWSHLEPYWTHYSPNALPRLALHLLEVETEVFVAAALLYALLLVFLNSHCSRIVEKNPRKFKIDGGELASRRNFIEHTKEEVKVG